MAVIQTISLLLLLLAFEAEAQTCAPYTAYPWTNSGWTRAVSSPPDSKYIPDFTPPADYLYLQTTTTSPKTGTLVTYANSVTLNEGDIIQATFFRHVEVYEGDDRITLSFYIDDGTGHNRIVLKTTNYDEWDTVSVSCSATGVKCCGTYPCSGHFQVDGEVLHEYELTAISDLQVCRA